MKITFLSTLFLSSALARSAPTDSDDKGDLAAAPEIVARGPHATPVANPEILAARSPHASPDASLQVLIAHYHSSCLCTVCSLIY